MAEKRARPDDIVLGVRVRRTLPNGQQQVGLVVPQSGGNRKLVEVLPEGSSNSRPKEWPLAELTVLPKAQQLQLHGGRFKPPQGYPFRTTRQKP